MLGGHAAPAANALFQHFFAGGKHAGNLVLVAFVEEEDRVDVSVAGMGHVDDPQVVLPPDFRNPTEDVRQPSARHDSVLDAIARTQTAQRPDCHLAALPQQLPLLGSGSRHNLPGLPLPAQLYHLLLLLVQPGRRSVQLDHHDRLGVEREPEMERFFHRTDDPLIHQFHGRGNHPGGDDAADGVGGIVDRVEDGPHRAVVLRVGCQADPDLGDDAQGAFAPHQQTDEVELRGVVDRPEREDRAVAQHRFQAQHVVEGYPVFERVRSAGIGAHVTADGAGRLAGGVGRVMISGPGEGTSQLEVGYARLRYGEAIAEVDLDDLFHSGQHHHHAAPDRQTSSGQTRPGPTRNYRHVVLVGKLDDFGNLLGRPGKDHYVRPVLLDRERVALVDRQVRPGREHVLRAESPAKGFCERSDAEVVHRELNAVGLGARAGVPLHAVSIISPAIVAAKWPPMMQPVRRARTPRRDRHTVTSSVRVRASAPRYGPWNPGVPGNLCGSRALCCIRSGYSRRPLPGSIA